MSVNGNLSNIVAYDPFVSVLVYPQVLPYRFAPNVKLHDCNIM